VIQDPFLSRTGHGSVPALPWDQFSRLKGRRLATIAQEKVFQLMDVYEDRVVVRVSSTGKVRTIGRDEFEAVWHCMTNQFKVSWNEVREKYSSVNPSYVIAILARLPGVRVSTSPLEIGLRTIVTGVIPQRKQLEVKPASG
jgi:hypothetical protein